MAALTSDPRRGRSGFTMVEMMVTLSILAIGLLAMLMLQVQALTDGSRGRHSTAAAMMISE